MNKKFKLLIIELIKTMFITALIVIGISMIAQPTIVKGQSMYPTLEEGDYIMVNRLAYTDNNVKRGDIVIFKTELIDDKYNMKKNLVKRVIALPNEHLIIKDGEVYIDGVKLQEKYLKDIYTKGSIDKVIPSNSVFVMGDNRGKSNDSRNCLIGDIDLEDLIGKAYIRIYPFNKIGKLN